MDDDRLAILASRVDRLLENQRELEGGKNKRKQKKSRQRVFIVDAYLQWRYENPVASRIVVVFTSFASVCLFSMAVWWLAETQLGRLMGLDIGRQRLTNAYYAVLWSMGAGDITEEQARAMVPKRYHGTVERAVNDALLVTLYENGKQSRRLIRPANVVVVDNGAFKVWAQGYQLKGVAFDIYAPVGELMGYKVWSAVIWHQKTPINVSLVEMGIGYPEETPPTPVVNEMFSRYYWGLAAGKGGG